MFQNKMVTPATPERVFALCKLIEKQPMTSSELKERFEPSFLEQKTAYFSDYRTAAEELHLISTIDNTISLAVSPESVANIQSMRQYINGILSEFSEGQFYRVTAEYFAMGKKVLEGEQNIVNLASQLRQNLNMPSIDAPAMRAWRFWVSFLGFGYLQNMFFIPNPGVFLWDIIQKIDYNKNQLYSFSEFMDKIQSLCSIILGDDYSSKQLNYGFSNGLRMLHDNKKIKLEHILDQSDIWSLYPLSAHSITGTVTNITILQ